MESQSWTESGMNNYRDSDSRKTSKKVQESRSLWYGHVMRGEEEEYVGKRVMVIGVSMKRRKVRPKPS